MATAKLFAAEDAKVVITGRRQKVLDEAVRSIGSAALGVQGDVSKMIDLNKLFETVKNKFGHLDIVFANAGFGEVIPFGEVSEDDFDRHFATNVKPPTPPAPGLPSLDLGGLVARLGRAPGYFEGSPAPFRC